MRVGRGSPTDRDGRFSTQTSGEERAVSSRLEFVVTGTGRSGTGHIAQALTSIGIPTGHEEWFSYRAGLIDRQAMLRRNLRSKAVSPLLRVREELRRRSLSIRGDASWMAVPRLPRYQGVVLLQVRHPLKVASSILGTGFFSSAEPVNSYERFARAHFHVSGEPEVDAVRWWCEWNSRAAERANAVYALEGLSPQLLGEIARMIDSDRDVIRRIDDVVTDRKDVNDAKKRKQDNPVISWSDLPVALRERVAQLSRSFGYEPDDPDHAPNQHLHILRR